jgi:CelD/BcsL family acetyltransferase involved in cellulose biosynthesis
MKVPSEWRDEVTPGEACPVLKFPDGTGELSMLIPPNLRQNLRFYQKRAARLGAVRFERATSATLEELFEQFLRLHAARWATQDLPGVLGNPRVRQFQRTTAEEFLRCGRLRLSALRIGGRVIAVFYGFRGRSDVCFYLSGFDPEYSRVSPGTLLIGQAIDDALQDGAAEFNFLRGRESYKYLWGATDRPCYRRRIERSPSLAGLRARSP